MAGKRRGTGKPMRREARPGRRRAVLETELAAQTSPAGRVGAAAEYLRAVLARHPAAAVADDVVAYLIEAAERIQREGVGK